jgi:HEAT repeat protein
LGFLGLPKRDYDLRTSEAKRVEQLCSLNPLDWRLAAKKLRSDSKLAHGQAMPALLHALGRSASQECGIEPAVRSAILAVSEDPIRDGLRMSSSDDAFTRAGAICILGMETWKDQRKDARWERIKEALHDPSPLVRSLAIGCAPIFRERSEEVAPRLIELLADEASPGPTKPSVGTCAIWSLTLFSSHAKAAIPLLKRAAFHEDPTRMRAAWHAIWQIAKHDPQKFDAILRWSMAVLKDSSVEPLPRIMAAECVAMYAGKIESAVASLISMFRNKQLASVPAVLRAIDHLHGFAGAAHSAIPTLISLMDDPNDDVRQAARRAVNVIRFDWLSQCLARSALSRAMFSQ